VLLVRRVEKARGGMRVEFVCGGRAVRSAREDYLHLTEAATQLSSSAADLPASVQKLLADAKAAERERWALLELLAAYHAAELLRTPAQLANMVWIDHELPQHNIEYMKLLAAKLTTAAKCIALLISPQADPASVVLARSAELGPEAFNAGTVLRQALTSLGARGGGSATLAQGAVPLAQLPELRHLLKCALTAPAAGSGK
jgi:alanyl-tRNA synthetase